MASGGAVEAHATSNSQGSLPPGSEPAQELLAKHQGLYKPDIRYEAPGAGVGRVDEVQLRKIVQSMVPHAAEHPAEELKCTLVTGGITNQLFKVAPPQGQPLLVRVFGGEGMIDRDLENATYVALSEAQLAPPYYGRFGNGRIEGFLPSRALELGDMAEPSVFPLVAEQMAKLHKFDPKDLAVFYREPSLWAQLIAWLEQAQGSVTKLKAGCFGEEVARRTTVLEYDLLGPSLERARKEIADLQREIPTDAPSIFSHNDVLSGNVLKDPATGEVRLIDFEYGGCNFRGFDIANHWNEWAGGTQEGMNGVPEYGRFPTSLQQLDFCKAYLRKAQGSEEGVEALVKESLKFVLVNHWYWGMWALNRAAEEGIKEFDYIQYARHRLARYYAVKEC